MRKPGSLEIFALISAGALASACDFPIGNVQVGGGGSGGLTGGGGSGGTTAGGGGTGGGEESPCWPSASLQSLCLGHIEGSGTGSAKAHDLAVDTAGSGDVIVVGELTGTVMFDAYQLTSKGGTDAFVLRLDANLTGVAAAMSFGGPGDDRATAAAIDDDGKVFIAGDFQGEMDFSCGPVCSGCSLSSTLEQPGEPGVDAFAARLDHFLCPEWYASTLFAVQGEERAHVAALSGEAFYVAGTRYGRTQIYIQAHDLASGAPVSGNYFHHWLGCGDGELHVVEPLAMALTGETAPEVLVGGQFHGALGFYPSAGAHLCSGSTLNAFLAQLPYDLSPQQPIPEKVYAEGDQPSQISSIAVLDDAFVIVGSGLDEVFGIPPGPDTGPSVVAALDRGDLSGNKAHWALASGELMGVAGIAAPGPDTVTLLADAPVGIGDLVLKDDDGATVASFSPAGGDSTRDIFVVALRSTADHPELLCQDTFGGPGSQDAVDIAAGPDGSTYVLADMGGGGICAESSERRFLVRRYPPPATPR